MGSPRPLLARATATGGHQENRLDPGWRDVLPERLSGRASFINGIKPHGFRGRRYRASRG